MQMTLCTVVLTPEQFEELDAHGLYELDYDEGDGTFFMHCYDDDTDCIEPDFLQALRDLKVTGQLHFFQGPSNYGRCDYSEFGYDFEDGILSNLEAVVTWRKVAPPK